MGLKETAEGIKAVYTEFICVLCGSVWNSDDYDWGVRTDVRSGSVVRRCDWSCPQCGGVVVEYARHMVPAYPGESILTGRHA